VAFTTMTMHGGRTTWSPDRSRKKVCGRDTESALDIRYYLTCQDLTLIRSPRRTWLCKSCMWRVRVRVLCSQWKTEQHSCARITGSWRRSRLHCTMSRSCGSSVRLFRGDKAITLSLDDLEVLKL